MKLYKFGGSSLRDKEAFLRTLAIISDSPPSMVVASATYNTTNNLERYIDLLKASSLEGHNFFQEAILDHHALLAKDLGIFDHFEKFLASIDQKRKDAEENLFRQNPMAFSDEVYTFGEKLSSKLLSLLLESEGQKNFFLDVQKVMATNDDFNQALPLPGMIKKRAAEIKMDQLIVTQGFIGRSPQGFSTTLGREGSDYSAVLLSEAMGLASCTIWTDVAGVATFDPRVIPTAKFLDKLSYEHAEALAFGGAKVLFPRTLRPAKRCGLSVFVKSTFCPQLGGTCIGEFTSLKGVPVAMATRIYQNRTILTLVGRALALQPERRLREVLREFDTHLMPFAEDEHFISFVLSPDLCISLLHDRIFDQEIL